MCRVNVMKAADHSSFVHHREAVVEFALTRYQRQMESTAQKQSCCGFPHYRPPDPLTRFQLSGLECFAFSRRQGSRDETGRSTLWYVSTASR